MENKVRQKRNRLEGTVTIRISKKDLDGLIKIAFDEWRPLSFVIRQAIKEFLERKEK